MEAQYRVHARFRTFGTDWYAQSVLINKNFCVGSSVSVRSLLRVRCWLGRKSSGDLPHLELEVCLLDDAEPAAVVLDAVRVRPHLAPGGAHPGTGEA